MDTIFLEKFNAFRAKIGSGHDGIIRRIELLDFRNCTVEISYFDWEEDKTKLIVFKIKELVEFKVFQEANYYNGVLFDGIFCGITNLKIDVSFKNKTQYEQINDLHYLNIGAYLDETTSNIDAIRKSDTYFIGKSIDFEIIPYTVNK